MGTSSDHVGGSGGAWEGAKRASTEFAKHGDRRRAYRALGRLVVALGGANGLAGRSKVAAAGMRKAAMVLGGARAEGLDSSLEAAGLGHLVGQPADQVIAALVDLIAGNGEDREGQAAREAACDVLEALADESESYEELSAALEGNDDLDGLLERFLAGYIYRLLLPVLAERTERLEDLDARAQRDRELREAVAAVVELQIAEGNLNPDAWPTATEEQLEGVIEAAFRYLEEQDY